MHRGESTIVARDVGVPPVSFLGVAFFITPEVNGPGIQRVVFLVHNHNLINS